MRNKVGIVGATNYRLSGSPASDCLRQASIAQQSQIHAPCSLLMFLLEADGRRLMADFNGFPGD